MIIVYQRYVTKNNYIVPTTAMINYVTTRKNGGWWINQGSLNGETMVWIYGLSRKNLT